MKQNDSRLTANSPTFTVEYRKLSPKPARKIEQPDPKVRLRISCTDQDTKEYMCYGRSISNIYGWGK